MNSTPTMSAIVVGVSQEFSDKSVHFRRKIEPNSSASKTLRDHRSNCILGGHRRLRRGSGPLECKCGTNLSKLFSIDPGHASTGGPGFLCDRLL